MEGHQSAAGSVDDASTGVAIKRIHVQVVTADFFAEDDDQESPKHQADVQVDPGITDLSRLEGRFLAPHIALSESAIDLETGHQTSFQFLCRLEQKGSWRSNELGSAISVAPNVSGVADTVKISRNLLL
jgi:hypothetical protein